jgi:hemerythrin-like domain-containing protein
MPIKRNENIVLLSKDHHFALLFCWKIRNGLKYEADLQRIRSYINYFWDTHLHKHFTEEEIILFKDIDDHLVKTALDQHKEITSQIDIINSNKNISAGIYNKLADIVDAHIRFEERELFPHLETLLSEHALNKIGLQLNKEHSIIPDDYADEFWLKK